MADQATQDLTLAGSLDPADNVYSKEAALDASRRTPVSSSYPGNVERIEARIALSNSGGNNSIAIVDTGVGGIRPIGVSGVVVNTTQIVLLLSKTYARAGSAFLDGNSVISPGYIFGVETVDLDEIVFRCVETSGPSYVNPLTDTGLAAAGGYLNFQAFMFPV